MFVQGNQPVWNDAGELCLGYWQSMLPGNTIISTTQTSNSYSLQAHQSTLKHTQTDTYHLNKRSSRPGSDKVCWYIPDHSRIAEIIWQRWRHSRSVTWSKISYTLGNIHTAWEETFIVSLNKARELVHLMQNTQEAFSESLVSHVKCYGCVNSLILTCRITYYIIQSVVLSNRMTGVQYFLLWLCKYLTIIHHQLSLVYGKFAQYYAMVISWVCNLSRRKREFKDGYHLGHPILKKTSRVDQMQKNLHECNSGNRHINEHSPLIFIWTFDDVSVVR